MATTTRMVQVNSAHELDSAIASYVAQGFVVSNRTPDSVLMFKKNEFNILWAVVGFLLCVLPLLIYLIVYATQSDQMVEIRINALAGAGADGPQMSPDRHYWWNGTEWRRADQEVPPTARRSDDGRYWWDGTEWRSTDGPALTGGSEAPTTLWAPPADPERPGPDR